MPKLKLGDIFEIKTQKGNGYFQCVYSAKSNGELIKVFYKLHRQRPANLEDIVYDDDFYYIGFPLKFALKRKLVELVGHIFVEKDFEKPQYARSPHVIRGEFQGWHIIDTTTLKRTLVPKLTEEQKRLSPHGIVNDIYIKDRFEEGWRLESWLADRFVGDRKAKDGMEKDQSLEVLSIKVNKGPAGVHIRIISDDSIVESKSLKIRHKLEDMIKKENVGVVYDVSSEVGFMDVKIDVKDVAIALNELKVILGELNLTKCSTIGTDYL